MNRFHVCQSIRGALHNWNNRDYQLAFPTMTKEAAKEYLMDCLARGWEVLPLGEACEGFSYQHGCPGHEVPDPPAKLPFPASKEHLFNLFRSDNG